MQKPQKIAFRDSLFSKTLSQNIIKLKYVTCQICKNNQKKIKTK